jgi:pimeloyl-ACP methyl ester carboxylesterase
MHEHIVEDRVFGLEKTIPPRAPLSEPSRSYDLFSVGVEGAEAVYACQGTVNHPPLVFVHGWGASHKFWRPAFTAFSPRYRCLAPDLPGFGLSEKPERDYSVEALAGWLGRFLDALRLPRVTLVGHSMGGTIGLLFALDHPERVERLAVANPVIEGRTAFSRRTRLLLAPGVSRLLYSLAHCGPLRRWATKDFSYVQCLDDELAQDVIRTTYRSSIESFRSLLRVDLGARLDALAVPTLAIGTDRDRLVAPDQVRRIARARQAEISECGHIPLLERAQEFNRVLDGWLREGAPPAGHP